jgi:hypothetical protein
VREEEHGNTAVLTRIGQESSAKLEDYDFIAKFKTQRECIKWLPDLRGVRRIRVVERALKLTFLPHHPPLLRSPAVVHIRCLSHDMHPKL